MNRWLSTAVLPFVLLATMPAAAQTPDAQKARYLAANCANCHGTSGSARGDMPSINGLSRDRMIELLKQFREEKRAATIMHQLAKGYSDEQIELIASYFARQQSSRY